MATTEHTINDALASLLRTTRRAWQTPDVVRSENTGMLKGSAARPDILVLEPNVSPVVIETEVLPAVTVEADALHRLGNEIRTTGRTILSAIAVRMPIRLRDRQSKELGDEIRSAYDFEIALFTGRDSLSYERWPRTGWLKASISDISLLAQSAAVPPEVIETAADDLVAGVSEAAGMLSEIATKHPGAVHKISEQLFQEDGEQTRRMAATILANAFIFHQTLAGGPGGLANVKSIDELRGLAPGLTKAALLVEWRKILKVNYWPIFDIARRILETVPVADSRPLIEDLAATADRLLENRLMRSHDLTGAVFQRLISDRKFLAAYYTTPASAALLTGLAIPSKRRDFVGHAWNQANDVTALRIADFACGTGTLLTTTYQRVSQLHEIAGGDSEAIHPQMMSRALVGCDVLPAAAHLTASMLAGAHPTTTFGGSSILTVAYGLQPDGDIRLGSLDLLSPQGLLGYIAITAKATGGRGETEQQTWEALPHSSFDLVIMNPPFTRATGHEGEKIGVPNPMFAAFRSTDEEQRMMSAATKKLTKGTTAHGNAGEASIFLVLADDKVKPGGRIALVMPLSLVAGDAWEESRLLLARDYDDLIIVSIAGAGDDEMSFSADTGMGECLIVGTKRKSKGRRAIFVVLNERPPYPLIGWALADQIQNLSESGNLRKLEDGPNGGSSLSFGDEIVGEAIEGPLPATGGWNLARISDLSLAQAAHQLVDHAKLWLPTMPETSAAPLAVCTLEKIGSIGPYHSDVSGDTAAGGVRGPFQHKPIRPGRVPTYPILWAHDAERERTICFDADEEGIPRVGADDEEQASIDAKIVSVWATASHLHFNQNFRFNSQSTAMQYTERETIGGRAWIAIRLNGQGEELAMALWGNTSIGLLLHWWHANKQQSGRGNIGKSSLQQLTVLDVDKLGSAKLTAAQRVFEDLKDRALLPAHEMAVDPVRADLDRRVLTEVLGLPAALHKPNGPIDLLRRKLAWEPSIRGAK